MEYRILPRGGEKISVIGLGGGYIGEGGEKEMREALELAVGRGVNYFDLAMSEASPFAVYGETLKDRRKELYY